MVELAHGDRVPIHWGNGQVRPKADRIQNAMVPYWFLCFYFSMLVICSSHLGISLLITFDNIWVQIPELCLQARLEAHETVRHWSRWSGRLPVGTWHSSAISEERDTGCGIIPGIIEIILYSSPLREFGTPVERRKLWNGIRVLFVAGKDSRFWVQSKV